MGCYIFTKVMGRIKDYIHGLEPETTQGILRVVDCWCGLPYRTIYGRCYYLRFHRFFQPIANEFGWSYTQVSFAASLRGMETGLLAPIVGLRVDRWGSRRLILSGAILSGLGLMLLSQVTSLAMFYGAFAMMSLGLLFLEIFLKE